MPHLGYSVLKPGGCESRKLFFFTGSKLTFFAMSMMLSPQIWKLCKF